MEPMQYDADLEMFVEPEHDLDVCVLLFWRTLVEQGRLRDDVEG